MRALIAILFTAGTIAAAAAQVAPTTGKGGDARDSTGRTHFPADQRTQSQGPTGPLETKPGGTPAESPQGQTPGGMQAAPEGSAKTIVDTAPTPPK